MPTKIPSIGSSNWGQDLNNIFNDITVTTDGANFLAKPTPGVDYTNMGDAAKIDPRAIAAGDLTVYVDAATGSDTNDGLSATTQFATLQKAIELANTIQYTGYTITIELASGDYIIEDASKIEIDSANIVTLKGMGAAVSDVNIVSNGVLGGGVYGLNRMIFVKSTTYFENLTIKSNTGGLNNEGVYTESAVSYFNNVDFDSLLIALTARGDGTVNMTGTFNYTNLNIALNANFNGTFIITEATEEFTAVNNYHFAFGGKIVSTFSAMRSNDTTSVGTGFSGNGGQFFYGQCALFLPNMAKGVAITNCSMTFEGCGSNIVADTPFEISSNSVVDFVIDQVDGGTTYGHLAAANSTTSSIDRVFTVDRSSTLTTVGGDNANRFHPQLAKLGFDSASATFCVTDFNFPYTAPVQPKAFVADSGAYIGIGAVTGIPSGSYTVEIVAGRNGLIDIF